MNRAARTSTPRYLLALLLINVCALGVPSALAESCNEGEAINTMMALNRAQSRMMSQGGSLTANSPAIQLARESAAANALLKDKKYDEACKAYQNLAAKYNVDLAKEREGLLSYEELAKDGGKRGGDCGVAEASKKMMAMHKQLQDQVASGNRGSEVYQEFSKDTSTFGELMVTNPNQVCSKLEELKPKYNLQ